MRNGAASRWITFTIKASRKFLGLRMDGEIHRHNNRVFVLIVSVSRGLALICVEPFPHPIDGGRKILAG